MTTLPHRHAPRMASLAICCCCWSVLSIVILWTPLGIWSNLMQCAKVLLGQRPLSALGAGWPAIWLVCFTPYPTSAVLLVFTVVTLERCFFHDCSHRRWQLVGGAVAGSIVCVTHLTIVFPVVLWNYPLWASLLIVVIGAGAGSGLLVGACSARDMIFGRRITQDGTLCWECSYPMLRAGSTMCPECGSAHADRAVGFTSSHPWLSHLALSMMSVSVILAAWWVAPRLAISSYIACGGSRSSPSPWNPPSLLESVMDLAPQASNGLVATYLGATNVDVRRVAADIRNYRTAVRIHAWWGSSIGDGGVIDTGRLSSEVSHKLLHAIFEDVDDEVRRQAAQTYFQLAGTDEIVEGAPLFLDNGPRQLLLKRYGIPALATLLLDRVRETRQAAAGVLNELGFGVPETIDMSEVELRIQMQRVWRAWGVEFDT